MGSLLEIAIATIMDKPPQPSSVVAPQQTGSVPGKTRFRDPAFRRAIIGARDDAQLEEWRAPLILGHMVVCGNCDAYQFAADPAQLGYCSRYHTEAAPFMPFPCPGFETAKEPTAPAYLPDRDGARARPGSVAGDRRTHRRPLDATNRAC